MSYVPLTPLPGVCKSDSAYANSLKYVETNGKGIFMGRYTDMAGCRFIANKPEKKGGWAPLTASTVQGVTRGMKDWRDYSQNIYAAYGTSKKLYVWHNSLSTLLNITPLRSVLTGSLSGAITTTTSSTTVTITHTAHGLASGDYVQLTTAAAYNGVTVTGTFFVTVTGPDAYTIICSDAATGSGTGGGTTAYSYYRVVLSSPFTTVSGSNIVTVTHTAHGAIVGDTVIIAGASAVGGITLSGSYTVASTTSNTYTVLASSMASSSTTGGGMPSLQYEINVGNTDTGFLVGYGLSGYGSGGYGEAATSSAYTLNARVWTLDSYGQQLIACPYKGVLYIWDPSTYASNNGRAYPLYGSPTGVTAMVVTPERFVLALGQAGNDLVVNWPVQTDYTNWTPLPTNTANSRTVQIGSYLIGGKAARDGTTLIFTNSCCYAFTYTGDTYIYDSTASGQNSGLISPQAACSYAGNVYWMGPTEFWCWNGTVAPLDSNDIRDYVFKNLTQQQRFKCFAVSNTAKKEITFYYPANGNTEITNSVTWHIDQECWSIDEKSRTSQIDALLFAYPLSADADGNLWQEEYGLDANGAALDAYVTLSPMAISKGERRSDIMGFMPDFERQTGDCLLSVLLQTYPKDAVTALGPFTINTQTTEQILDLRESATFIGYKIESDAVGGDFRIGLCQVDSNTAGARR